MRQGRDHLVPPPHLKPSGPSIKLQGLNCLWGLVSSPLASSRKLTPPSGNGGGGGGSVWPELPLGPHQLDPLLVLLEFFAQLCQICGVWGEQRTRMGHTTFPALLRSPHSLPFSLLPVKG